MLARLTRESYEPLLTLPSGGDTSYAGLVWHDGLLWISYYSSHEGKSSIYLAKTRLPQEALKGGARPEVHADTPADLVKGSIEVGKLADLALLSDDLMTCDANRIKDIQVLMTVLGGKIVYERK